MSSRVTVEPIYDPDGSAIVPRAKRKKKGELKMAGKLCSERRASQLAVTVGSRGRTKRQGCASVSDLRRPLEAVVAAGGLK